MFSLILANRDALGTCLQLVNFCTVLSPLIVVSSETMASNPLGKLQKHSLSAGERRIDYDYKTRGYLTSVGVILISNTICILIHKQSELTSAVSSESGAQVSRPHP